MLDSSDIMIDEPGSFYICTETSPRCFVIQKVRAKDLPKVCDELGVLSLDDVDCGSSPRRSGEFDGKNVSGGQRGQGGGPGGSTPPLPILPSWWGPDCERKLEATCGYCTNGDVEVDAFGETLSYDQQQVAAQTIIVNDGYDMQQGIMQDGMMEFVIDTVGDNTHDFMSPSSTGEQQLRVSVDHYPATLTYSSVMSSPSDDRPLSTGAANTPGGHPLEITDDNQSAKWAPSSPGTTMELSFDELKTRVRHQLEYYFSRENLAADAYLRSQMDNDQFVKVTTLASFNMVKRLTTDFNLILQALRESPVLQVNDTGDKVRPIHKRCTLILREIPEGTKKEEVEELFASPQCPKIVNSEYALNNIWYVNFETDEDAQKAFLYLRQKVQSFKGKPILARIKTAPIPRVQQNGSRPTPPSTLPLQNMPYPAVSPSPNVVVTGASQILLSPSDSSTLANAPTPFSTNSGVGPFSTTPIDNNNVAVMDTAMTIPGSSPLYYYSPGHSQSVGSTSAIMGAPPATVLSSTSWPQANSNSFDLGYILAMNGFQAQGAYRPAVFVPAPISPACQVGTVSGPRFPVDRSQRKPRAGANCYQTHHQHPIDRNGAQSADSGRPPPSYSRYGPASGARSANGNNNNGSSSGYYQDRKSGPYWKYDQNNIHYNNIRSNRPNRYALNGNYAGNGSGMNNFGMPGDGRPRYPRSDRGGRYGGGHEYWNQGGGGGYQPKPHYRKPPGTTSVPAATSASITTTTAATAAGTLEKKREDSFDLHSSSFPPLPTASAVSLEDLEKEIETLENSFHESTTTQQPTQILQRDHSNDPSGAISSPSPILKVQPRVKLPRASSGTTEVMEILEKPQSTGKTSEVSIETKESQPTAHHDQKPENLVMSSAPIQKTVSGVGTTRSGGGMIPVAVVQPNAQLKQLKVATADKATATDLSPPIVRAHGQDEECSLSKSVSSDTKFNELLQEKIIGEKKLSYADMAKHAAAARANIGNPIMLSMSSPAVVVQKSSTASGSAGPVNVVGNGKDQATTTRRLQADKEKETGKWRDSDIEEEDEDGDFSQYRRVKKKFGSRKHNRSFRNSEGQEQCEGGAQVPPASY